MYGLLERPPILVTFYLPPVIHQSTLLYIWSGEPTLIFQFVTHCINLITVVGCAVHQEHFSSYLVALHVTQFLKISYITKKY